MHHTDSDNAVIRILDAQGFQAAARVKVTVTHGHALLDKLTDDIGGAFSFDGERYGSGPRSGVTVGSPRDPTRPCVEEETRVTPRNPWWAVRDSNPGPSG